MFASKSLGEHLVRGLVGLVALTIALVGVPSHPWLSLAGLPVALVALRGCPLCWTVGLVQTVVVTLRARSSEGSCTDDRCARSLAVAGRSDIRR